MKTGYCLFTAFVLVTMAAGAVCSQSANELVLKANSETTSGDYLMIYDYLNGGWVNTETSAHLHERVSGIAVGDVNNDGVTEIATSMNCPSDGCTGGLVQFLRRDASGQWSRFFGDTTLSTYAGATIPGIFVKDLDNDGMNEVLACGPASGPNVLVYENHTPGAETFTRYTLKSGGSTNDCAVSDMDGDGYPEIFFQGAVSGPILVYEYDGSGYAQVASISSSDWRWSRKVQLSVVDDMDSGDLNNDGVDDVVFCGNNGYAVVLTYASGGYASIKTPGTLLDSPIQSCSIEDLNGDGYNDLVLASKKVMYLEKTSKLDHGFDYTNTWNGPSLPTGFYPMHAACTGDADNDGRSEYFLGSNSVQGPYTLTSFQNDSTQTPYGPGFDATGLSNEAFGCAVGDIDAVGVRVTYVCGDGIKQATEACDGGDLAGKTCESLGFMSGTLSCTAGCTLDTSQCIANPCGDGYCDGAIGENCNTCPADCVGGTSGGTCGGCFRGVCDGVCNSAKEGSNCADCNKPVSYCCGDGVCGGIENPTSCAYDCPV